jgi:hypothetical protein
MQPVAVTNKQFSPSQSSQDDSTDESASANETVERITIFGQAIQDVLHRRTIKDSVLAELSEWQVVSLAHPRLTIYAAARGRDVSGRLVLLKGIKLQIMAGATFGGADLAVRSLQPAQDLAPIRQTAAAALTRGIRIVTSRGGGAGLDAAAGGSTIDRSNQMIREGWAELHRLAGTPAGDWYGGDSR